MFHRIRWRLTLWYSGVLATALLILGIALYLSVSHVLLSPIDDYLHSTSQQYAQTWSVLPLVPCQPPPAIGFDVQQTLVVCYDNQGNAERATRLANFVPRFISPSLSARALEDGSASDVVDVGNGLGKVKRYAVRVVDVQGNVLGVVQVGSFAGGQLDALETLRTMLILGSVVALLVAGVGGFFLANRALQPARLAHRRQREFIADASHELRTPLTMLRANAEVLLRGRARLDPDDVPLLEDVVAETSHMSALANSMLSLARLDAGDVHLEQEVVDLSAIAVDVVHRIRALAGEKSVTVRTETDEPALVLGDRLLLEQAAVVLADNAVKYNRPGGEVVVRAGTRVDRVYLEIRDTGIGIAPEHLPRLGERFYRVDKARSREAGGAGLGVSIAQSIAARHGGALDLSSEPGRGTTATLSLPAARIGRSEPA